MKRKFLPVAAMLAALSPGPSLAHDRLHHDAQIDAPAAHSDRSIYNLESK